MTDLRTRARRMTDLYYAAELATRAGADDFPPALASQIDRAGADLHHTITADLHQLSATHADRANAAAAALDELVANARARARGHIAGTAYMTVPRESAVGEAVRQSYMADHHSSYALDVAHIRAMNALIDAVTGRMRLEP